MHGPFCVPFREQALTSYGRAIKIPMRLGVCCSHVHVLTAQLILCNTGARSGSVRPGRIVGDVQYIPGSIRFTAMELRVRSSPCFIWAVRTMRSALPATSCLIMGSVVISRVVPSTHNAPFQTSTSLCESRSCSLLQDHALWKLDENQKSGRRKIPTSPPLGRH